MGGHLDVQILALNVYLDVVELRFFIEQTSIIIFPWFNAIYIVIPRTVFLASNCCEYAGGGDHCYSDTVVSDHAKYGHGPDNHDWLWRVLLLDNEA